MPLVSDLVALLISRIVESDLAIALLILDIVEDYLIVNGLIFSISGLILVAISRRSARTKFYCSRKRIIYTLGLLKGSSF